MSSAPQERAFLAAQEKKNPEEIGTKAEWANQKLLEGLEAGEITKDGGLGLIAYEFMNFVHGQSQNVDGPETKKLFKEFKKINKEADSYENRAIIFLASQFEKKEPIQ